MRLSSSKLPWKQGFLTLVVSGLLAAAALLLFVKFFSAAAIILALFAIAIDNERAVRRQPDEAPVPDPAPGCIKALVVGSGPAAQALVKALNCDPRYRVVGCIGDDPVFGSERGDTALGPQAFAKTIIAGSGIEEVFFATEPTWQQTLAETLALDAPDVTVKIVPTAFESRLCLSRVRHCGDIAVVPLRHSGYTAWSALKRLFDLGAAVAGLILSLPIFFIAAIAIKITSRGPVIFAQERTGLGGKPFMMYKLRTMICDAEQATGPIRSPGKNDSRLTPIGRHLRLLRMDEIPQLWNVIRGDMSMIGPRPERPCFTDQYARLHPSYHQRHAIRPGITGLAQVFAGYHTDALDKLRFDLIYLSHLSPAMDLSVLFRTLWVVLRPQERQFERQAAETMP